MQTFLWTWLYLITSLSPFKLCRHGGEGGCLWPLAYPGLPGQICVGADLYLSQFWSLFAFTSSCYVSWMDTTQDSSCQSLFWNMSSEHRG